MVGGAAAGGAMVAGGGAAVGGARALACGCGAEEGNPMLSYVGTGMGAYVQETSYQYVGAGAGEFDVVQPKRSNLWIFIGGGIGVLVLLVIVVLLLIPGPTTTTTPATLLYDCDAGLANSQAGWSISKKSWCCSQFTKGCAAPAKKCTLWGDPHIISFDQVGNDKNQALSFYGDGDFWIVKSSTINIQGRFEGTKYTEGLAATNQIVVGGPFLNGHKIEVGTHDSGIVTVDGQSVFQMFPSTYKAADGSFTVTYDAEGEVPDVVPEGNKKRIVHMALPLGVVVHVYQWSNYLDVEITMTAQPGQDGACGNYNGDQGDDTTQTIMKRIGARVRPSENLLSGTAMIEFTPQMKKMMAAECPAAQLTAAHAQCTTSLGDLATVSNLVDSCKFDTCFGMNVRARSHAKTYA